jgi:hypothetical protein
MISSCGKWSEKLVILFSSGGGKEPKRKSLAVILMRTCKGSAGQKLALFEKPEAAGRFDGEDRVEL